MDAVDDYIPQPERPRDQPFLMPVEDVFGIKGRGTVVTGRIERGVVKTGEEIEIVGLGETRKTVVTGVEMFRKTLDYGEAGDNVGCLLRGIEREDIERGQVLAAPGQHHAAHQLRGQGLRPVEGRGRPAHAVLRRLPAAVLHPHDRRHRQRFELPEGVEMVMPGDNVKMKVQLIKPVALEEGLRFAIREGGRTVGAGVCDEGPRVDERPRGRLGPRGKARNGEERRPSHHHSGLHRVPGADLHDGQEPAQRLRPAGAAQVLPALPRPSPAPGGPVGSRC